MKKVLMIGLLAALTSTSAWAAAWTNTYHYLPQARFIPSSCTNVGVTGLSTGVCYFVVSVTNVGNWTAAQATTNGDFRVLLYALSEKLYNSIDGVASTARMTRVRSARTVLETSGADLKKSYVLEYNVNLGAVTIDGE